MASDDKSWWEKGLSWIVDDGLDYAMQWLGMEQQNSNIDKQLEAQKQEQAENREFNYQLWQDDNAYNTPAAQKARLEQAGLNADMMYGGSGVVNTSSSAPSPSQAMDWSALANKRTIGDVTSQALDNQLKQAQIDNINANTKKQGAETSILTDEASFKKALLEGELKIQNGVIKIQDVTAAEKSQNIKESQQRCEAIQTSMTEINARIEQIYNSIANDNARLDLEKVFNEANVRKLASESDLNQETANKIASELEKILRQYDDNHEIAQLDVINLGHNGKILLWNGRQAEFNARIGTFEGFTDDMDFFENATKFVHEFLNVLLHFVPGSSPLTQ